MENMSKYVERAIRKLKSIQSDVDNAIKYLEQEHLHKGATCEIASELYKANDLATALAKDAHNSSKLTESEDDSESNQTREMSDEEFEKAWAAIGFHGGGGAYSAEEFMRKLKEARKLL